MNADQAKVVAEVIGQNLQGEWMHTYKAINAVPDAKKDYKPADQFAHARGTSRITSRSATSASCTPSRPTASARFPAKCDAKTIPELADWYKHEMPKALEKVLALDGNHLSQIVEAWGMKLPSVTYLMFCNNHMIHHRGQLTTYIRPMGGKVPAMYGESFDEKMGG